VGSAVGCGGSEGPAGPQGPQGPGWEVGPGLALEGGSLRVDYGSVVQGSDPRLSDARAPLPGSGSYIQNGTAAQEASFAVSGTGQVDGQLTLKSDLFLDAQTSVESPTPLLQVRNTDSRALFLRLPLLTVDSAGGLLARGKLGWGVIPMSGAGERFMWHPYKAALRAGSAQAAWDDDNVGFYSWASGYDTTASGTHSLSHGDRCVASANVAACIGSQNTVSGTAGFSAGASNVASGFTSVAMGFTSVASGQGSVALGYRVAANANYTTALGHRVSTGTHQGSFIWGDASGTTVHESTAHNQFMVRAAGGVRLRTSASLSTGCDLPAGSGVFSCTSDRNQKEDFHRIDAETVLAKVARMPVQSWRYKDEAPGVRHLGPVAQDFRAAFGLGTDDTSIGLLDLDGVNMVAIQALERRTQELSAKSAEVDALRAELADMKRTLARLEARMHAATAVP
jgi:trimeric autotransporter adhesin